MGTTRFENFQQSPGQPGQEQTQQCSVFPLSYSSAYLLRSHVDLSPQAQGGFGWMMSPARAQKIPSSAAASPNGG